LYEPLLKLGYELVDTDVDGSLFRKWGLMDIFNAKNLWMLCYA
jgi:hypothetical protein